MDSEALPQLAQAWSADFLAVASAHPSAAILALIAALVSLVLTRSLLLFVVCAFLAVAAVFGAEPVVDPVKRWVFTIGCIVSILAMSLVAMTLKLRIRELRGELRTARSDRATLLAAYEEEASWRRPDA